MPSNKDWARGGQERQGLIPRLGELWGQPHKPAWQCTPEPLGAGPGNQVVLEARLVSGYHGNSPIHQVCYCPARAGPSGGVGTGGEGGWRLCALTQRGCASSLGTTGRGAAGADGEPGAVRTVLQRARAALGLQPHGPVPEEDEEPCKQQGEVHR
jgi:hypothetical protein